MSAELCLDARLTLGAGLSAAASALVSLAWGSPVAAIVQAVAGIVLAALAIRAARSTRPQALPMPSPPPSSAVADAVATLTGAGGRHARG